MSIRASPMEYRVFADIVVPPYHTYLFINAAAGGRAVGVQSVQKPPSSPLSPVEARGRRTKSSTRLSGAAWGWAR